MMKDIIIGILSSTLSTILNSSSRSLIDKWKIKSNIKRIIKEFKSDKIWSDAREVDSEQFASEKMQGFLNEYTVKIFLRDNEHEIQERLDSIIKWIAETPEQKEIIQNIFQKFQNTIEDFYNNLIDSIDTQVLVKNINNGHRMLDKIDEKIDELSNHILPAITNINEINENIHNINIKLNQIQETKENTLSLNSNSQISITDESSLKDSKYFELISEIENKY